MKRIAIVAFMLVLSLGAAARSIHYFTYSQATRTVNHLNRQSELMIYCGYDYEIETYVLINDVWMERVNSAYYEIWVYGFDAYTGEEVYMPLDLQCVWLYSAGRMYNAAQYLRFRVDARVPSFVWTVPPYNPYTRVAHRSGYVRSYHYDVHRHGWMPPAHRPGPGAHHPGYHPYYMRQPHSTPPAAESRWTPGVDRPKLTTSPSRSTSAPRPAGASPSSAPRNTSAAPSRSTSTSRSTGTATSPSRSTTATSTTPSKATSTSRSSTATTVPANTPSHSSSANTPTTGTKATSNSRSVSAAPAKVSAPSRPVSASPSTPAKASAPSRSVSASPATPAKASAPSRSISASPAKATNTSRSVNPKRQ